MDKIIIRACLNGARGRGQNPNVPWTPANVARAHGREPATPQEARQMLGVPQK